MQRKMTADEKKFVEEIAALVKKYAKKYNICVCSPIIAQAVKESRFGTSELAVNANNYFGLKYRDKRCPTACGLYKKVGSEQQPDGTYKEDAMDWYKFKNKEDCVIGYFDFTNIPNYANLKGVKSPEQYLQNIVADKYATSHKYYDTMMSAINDYDLRQYDDTTVYKVQAGVYSDKKAAEDAVIKLKRAGFNAVIIVDSN